MKDEKRGKSMIDVAIRTADIQLDQFLKLAGVVATGGEVKHLVEAGRLKVNDRRETARRRKLHVGDRVTVGDGDDSAVYRVAEKG